MGSEMCIRDRILAVVSLFVIPGKKGANKYGEAPIPLKKKNCVLLWTILIVFIGFIGFIIIVILGPPHTSGPSYPINSFKQEVRNLASEVTVKCINDSVVEVGAGKYSDLLPNQYVNCDRFISGTSTGIMSATTSNFDCDATISIDGIRFFGSDC